MKRSSRTGSRGSRTSSPDNASALIESALTGKGRRRRWIDAAAAAAAALALTGCTSVDGLGYYWQGAVGQWDILAHSEPIPLVIGKADPALAARLREVRAIRAFASRELALPDNASYTRYTDLHRQFVTWNVFAAPRLSLVPRQWCFPIAGCVDYRGYFDRGAAEREAAHLRADGDDVYIGGVPAYSTLGWFDDPVLSTFVRWPLTEVARLIFHELAHQVLYVRDDSVFNESFATMVSDVGLARWLAARRDPALDAEAARDRRLRNAFDALVLAARSNLERLYASSESDAVKLRDKQAAFAAMEAAYDDAKAGQPGLAGYDRWFRSGPNNASLAAIAIYTERIPAFREILREEDNDL
ncbi:MAG: aminopeptidase, partial [Casimicrobiaceae bacterium]